MLAPEGATKYAEQEGAFVFLTVIDAPTATGEAGSGATSFGLLCAAFFPWVIDALGEPEGDSVDLNETAAKTITRDQLDAYIERLADTSEPPLDVTGLLGFLASAFILNIETPEFANSSGDQALFEAGASVFPVFDGLSLTVPDPSGAGTKPITFETYALANSAYRETVSALFEQVEAVHRRFIGGERAATDGEHRHRESMAALIFVDYFCMMGRQLLQAARNLLDAFAWPLAATDSIDSILTAVNANGNTLEVGDIATPNQDFPLSAPVTLVIPELNYPIQASDTLQKIADRYSDSASPQRWQTTPAQLITLASNQVARILPPGVEIPIGEGYTTIGGDTFQSVADALGISVDALSNDSAIYTLQGAADAVGGDVDSIDRLRDCARRHAQVRCEFLRHYGSFTCYIEQRRGGNLLHQCGRRSAHSCEPYPVDGRGFVGRSPGYRPGGADGGHDFAVPDVRVAAVVSGRADAIVRVPFPQTD